MGEERRSSAGIPRRLHRIDVTASYELCLALLNSGQEGGIISSTSQEVDFRRPGEVDNPGW